MANTMASLQLGLRAPAVNRSRLQGGFVVAALLTNSLSLSGCSQTASGGIDKGMPLPSPSPDSSSSPAESKVSNQAWEHYQILNQLRKVGFTCPDGTRFGPNSVDLLFDCRLWEASRLHSQDMADKGYFSHQSEDGRSPFDRATAQGVQASSENIAAGASSAQGALDQWKTSNGHCLNMMNAKSKSFAVGYGFKQNSKYKHYWTQMFGRGTTGLDTSCHPVVSQLAFGMTTPVSAFLGAASAFTVGDAWANETASGAKETNLQQTTR